MSAKSPALRTLEDLLREYTVQVISHAESGTGFFIAPSVIATCAHVVSEVGENVVLVDCNGRKHAATVIVRRIDGSAPHDYPDLALLQVDGERDPDSGYVLLDPDVREDDEFFCWGYPKNYPNGDGLRLEFESLYNAIGFKDQLKLKNGQVQHGFSGAALLNKRTGAISGLIKLTRDASQDLGGRAVSVSLLTPLQNEEVYSAQSPDVAQRTLWGGLRAVSRIANDGHGSTSTTIADLVESWTSWSENRLQGLDASDELSGDLVDTALEKEWTGFVLSPSWRSRIQDFLKTFGKAADRLGVGRLPSHRFTVEGRYSEVRERLAAWLGATLPKWRAREAEIHRSGDCRFGGESMSHDYWYARDALNALVRLADPTEARLDLAFLVFGPLGSGKTHFVRTRGTGLGDVNSWLPDARTLAILLPIRSKLLCDDIEELILAKVREGTDGFAWGSLDDVDRILNALRIKLIVAVHDFGYDVSESFSYKAVCDFIESHSHLDSLRYLLAIQDTQLDVVLTSPRFWSRVAYYESEQEAARPKISDHARRIAGWLSLAQCNREHQIGYAILRRAGFAEAAILLEESRTVPSPLEAKIMSYLMRCEKDIETIASLHFCRFFEEFFDQLISRLGIPGVRESLDPAIRAVAWAAMRSSSLTPSRAAIVKALAEVVVDPEATLALLRKASLIGAERMESETRSSPFFEEPEARVYLNYPYLWSRELAEQLWKELDLSRGASDAKLIEWLEGNQTAGQVLEGILEFVLLLADADMGSGPTSQISRDRTAHLWALAFEQPKLPVAAPCLAARWASERTQKRLFAAVRGASEAIIERGALFALMFFAMETPALSAHQRFDTLQPHYGSIGASGLASYLLNGASRVFLSLEDIGKWENCVHGLAFAHLTGVCRELAWIAWEGFLNLCGDDVEENVGELMKGYLLYDKDAARDEYASWDRRQGKRPRYFRMEVILTALDHSWRAGDGLLGVTEFFNLLEGMGWYNGESLGIDENIAREMRSQANLSFGKHFRWLRTRGRSEEEEIQGYKALVRSLLLGNRRDIPHGQELGYFMLRHTDSIEARSAFAPHGMGDEAGGAYSFEARTAYVAAELGEEVDMAHNVESLRRFFDDYPIVKRDRPRRAG